MVEKEKSPVPEGTRLTTFVCTDKRVNVSLQKFKSVVNARFTPERRKELTRKLRDENIRIAEERAKEIPVDNSEESDNAHLTPSQIREKLKGGKHERQEKS